MSVPKGFTCECGEFHEFGFYVAAHADVELTHTCPECQAQHGIQRYHVWLKRKGKPALRATKESKEKS